MAKEKTFRPKPRVPKGLEDRFADAVRAEAAMIGKIREVYELYGFEPLETGAFEYADAIGKFLPDEDRPNEGVFAFQDDDEQWLALRYDLTAPLARLVAERYDALPKPFRRYQTGRVWRNEKPGPGRFREFTQFDADSVGAPSMAADAEMIMLLGDALEAVGVPRGQYLLKVNNRKVLNGVLETIGVLKEGDAGAELMKLRVLRAIDKFDRLGAEGVRQLLGEGRKDESGDFTQGAGLSEEQTAAVMAFVNGKGADFAATVAGLRALTGQSAEGAAGLAEMEAIGALLEAAGLGPERVEFDPSVVRGLGYYTGPVFEADLTFETKDEKGRPVRFGSVASGGRYDDLVKRFKGVEVPATGCSIGVSRLGAALRLLGRETAPIPAPIVVLVLDKDRIADAQAMVSELRNAGIRSELYLGGAGMRAQLKYADKRGAPIAVIEGEDEHAKGAVTLKDLLLGAQLAGQIEDNKEWREEQRQQETVPRGELVAAARRILARQAGEG